MGANIFKKLATVQNELKAPKGQYNSFGKYKYRSCEDILEAAKPLCVNHGLLLTISDSIDMIGGRFYVKAIAMVIDTESGEGHSVTAFAREEENKKGMDGSQVTGAASSYARKYALNGLFCIDDTKEDSDATNTHGKEEIPAEKPKEMPKQEWKESLNIPDEWKDKVVEPELISEAQAKRLYAISKGKTEQAKAIMQKYGFGSSKAITKDLYGKICEEVEKINATEQ